MKIADIRAREILDSRGMPTVEACVRLENGSCGRAAVPSGASTGAHEAAEKRDGGERYFGKGVRYAVQAVNGPIREALTGMRADEQGEIDRRLLALDGTKNKAALGANAMLAASMAAARAAAQAHGLPLWRYLGGAAGGGCPRLMMNVLNGGKHASNNVDIQEFMLVPNGALSAAEAVRMGAEIDHALKTCILSRGLSASVGDEGGFAPDLASDEEALDLLTEAAEKAGYEPGCDVGFALDMAAAGWVKGSGYRLPKRGADMTREELIGYVCALTEKYPIVRRLRASDGDAERALSGGGRRSVCDRPGAHRARREAARGDGGSDQAEPDWHADGDAGGDSRRARARYEGHRFSPQRRNDGRFHHRPRRRRARGGIKGRRARSRRAGGEI